uniref:Uncharacterized protein n=1 Tax=Timema monikensis TaxID=170555 RepID=A0A7R9HRE6_9NEOP|nr:unnamed protein product [Timema monikensis]
MVADDIAIMAQFIAVFILLVKLFFVPSLISNLWYLSFTSVSVSYLVSSPSPNVHEIQICMTDQDFHLLSLSCTRVLRSEIDIPIKSEDNFKEEFHVYQETECIPGPITFPPIKEELPGRSYRRKDVVPREIARISPSGSLPGISFPILPIFTTWVTARLLIAG